MPGGRWAIGLGRVGEPRARLAWRGTSDGFAGEHDERLGCGLGGPGGRPRALAAGQSD